MGILRADRITGLGGANAIKGSVFFNGQPSSFLRTDVDDVNYVLGTDDFTLELWYNATTLDATNGLIMFGPGGYGYYNSLFHFSGADVQMYISSNGSSWDIASGTKIGERIVNTWHHFALTREGSTFRGFVDGVLGATFTSSGSIRQGASEFNMNSIMIGHRITTTLGHISNFRYIKGRAVYTAAFTPPTNELEVTSDTILLCCQSPSNVLQEATGKTLIAEAGGSSNAVSATTNIGPPIATRFTPNSPVGFSTTTDVGSQYGTTFDGFGSFATSTYMVPPGGNTRERNRGRGVSFGGDNNTTSILFVDIQSQGNAQDFGDLIAATVASPGACASSTRGVYGGGTPSNTDTIGFITIANTANALDFGNLTQARRQLAACSNDTRGLFGSGRVSDPVNTIDFITIATTGDASDFGDVTTAARYLGSTSSTTRGFWFGGNAPTATNVINFVTIATTGDASDFGDLTEAKPYPTGCSSSTRAITFGGMVSSPNYVNTIEFFTMASAGNATDFGDCIEPNGNSSGMSNLTRGVRFAGGVVSGSYTNSIDFVNIASTGNASDFGDIGTAGGDGAGTSDSHGGLS